VFLCIIDTKFVFLGLEALNEFELLGNLFGTFLRSEGREALNWIIED
jgi:hypothetical protein